MSTSMKKSRSMIIYEVPHELVMFSLKEEGCINWWKKEGGKWMFIDRIPVEEAVNYFIEENRVDIADLISDQSAFIWGRTLHF